MPINLLSDRSVVWFFIHVPHSYDCVYLSLKMARSTTAVLLLLCSSIPYSFQDTAPVQLVQSQKNYGPDGPWHAVTVDLGEPPQQLDLYPGGTFGSIIFTDLVCHGQSAQPCGSGGLFFPEGSSTLKTGEIQFADQPGDTIGSNFTSGALLLNLGNSSYVRDSLTIGTKDPVVDFDCYMYSDARMVYPDGTYYPVQLGTLSLGADGADTNQTFPPYNSTLIPNNLHQNHIIASSSYGLHYGSVAFNLDLSLWLGGYDASRIVGPVSSQSYTNNAESLFILDLLDIAIVVDNGASPFPYPSKSGFLASGNTTISSTNSKSISVIMNPEAPYLNLPNSTCNAIAEELPVTYNSKYGLYLWNVDDPQYTKIITSPSYLSFIFHLSGGTNTIPINVPFQLLNLTLDAPLSSNKIQYFPCQPPQDPTSQRYGLGRAFLQAAFIGVNWGDNQKQWFLAQAPGPDTSSTPNYKPMVDGTPPSGAGGSWAATWKNSWTPLVATSNGTISDPQQGSRTSSSSGRGISSGAIVGIVIGAVVAFIILAVGFFVWRRKKRSRNSHGQPAQMTQVVKKVDDQAQAAEPPPGYHPAELHDSRVLASELSGSERFELSHVNSPTGY